MNHGTLAELGGDLESHAARSGDSMSLCWGASSLARLVSVEANLEIMNPELNKLCPTSPPSEP